MTIVPNFFKKEAGSRAGPGCDVELCVAAAVNQTLKILDRDLTHSNLYKCSYDASNHSPEEMRSGNPELNDVVFSLNGCPFDLDDCRFIRTRAVRCSEANKVVAPDKQGGRFR